MTKKIVKKYFRDETDGKKLLKLERPREFTPKHRDTIDCWCEPELDYIDPETGAAFYSHREIH